MAASHMQVIGAGFGRTGTTSLKAALETLGFGPCYHMVEVFQHPGHADVWMAAAEGRPVDWSTFPPGYVSTLDWPACSFYEELLSAHPDALVLLSIRDPESWYRSCAETIHRISVIFPVSLIGPFLPRVGRTFRMANRVVWKGTFGGRFQDKAYALAVYARHIEQVKERVPSERLLVYDVREGWEPLCRFLGVSVPDLPFPRLNDTEEFKRRIRIMQTWSWLLLTAAVVLGGLAVAWGLLGR